MGELLFQPPFRHVRVLNYIDVTAEIHSVGMDECRSTSTPGLGFATDFLANLATPLGDWVVRAPAQLDGFVRIGAALPASRPLWHANR